MSRNVKIPHSIRILLTSRCNLNCCFCLDSAENISNREDLHAVEWLKFFERIKDLRIFNVSLSGGEIFLRNDLFQLLEKLRENRMHRITLLTNGTLITAKIAEQLNRLKIKNISISIDGLEENHDKIRGTGSFQKTLNGILHLLTVGIIPAISFTPIKNNYKDIGSLIDFISSIGLPSIRINTLSPEGRCLNIFKNINLEYPQQLKEILEVIDEKKKQYPNFKIICELGFYYHLPQSYEFFQQHPQDLKIKHLKDGCGAATTSVTITSTGDVIPCEGLSAFKGSNIKEQDFLDIWYNSKNFKIIRELTNIPMDQNPYCKDCKFIFLCDGGCRATAYNAYNDLLAPDISCPYWKNKIVRNRETGDRRECH